MDYLIAMRGSLVRVYSEYKEVFILKMLTQFSIDSSIYQERAKPIQEDNIELFGKDLPCNNEVLRVLYRKQEASH